MLKNENLVINGVAYPDAVYKIGNRNIRVWESDITKANIEVFLVTYSDTTLSLRLERKDPINFDLIGLPNDSGQLTEALYESELQSQKPDELVDGTAVKDLVVV